MPAVDWSKIFKKYKGQWVAILDDEKTVVGNGKTPREALKMAQAKGYNSPTLAPMPSKLIPYVG